LQILYCCSMASCSYILGLALICSLVCIVLSIDCNTGSLESGLLTEETQAYILFAGSGYTFAGGVNSTFLTGDLASFPTASPLSGNVMVTLTGTENFNATETNVFANQVITSYDNALAKPNRNPISGDIGGLTLTPGVYFAETTLGVTGNITLDGQGNSDSVFIFITGTALFTGASTNVILIGNAQFCHVYWIVGSSATLGANNNVGGSFNAYASISVGSGTSIMGRLHARQALTIDSATIQNIASCTSSNDLAKCSTPVNLGTNPQSINDIDGGASIIVASSLFCYLTIAIAIVVQ